MAGSHEDGQTVLNFKSFMKKTGIAITEPLPPAAIDDSHAAGDAYLERNEADGGWAGYENVASN